MNKYYQENRGGKREDGGKIFKMKTDPKFWTGDGIPEKERSSSSKIPPRPTGIFLVQKSHHKMVLFSQNSLL